MAEIPFAISEVWSLNPECLFRRSFPSPSWQPLFSAAVLPVVKFCPMSNLSAPAGTLFYYSHRPRIIDLSSLSNFHLHVVGVTVSSLPSLQDRLSPLVVKSLYTLFPERIMGVFIFDAYPPVCHPLIIIHFGTAPAFTKVEWLCVLLHIILHMNTMPSN